MRLLVVDDSKEVRDFIRRMVGPLNIEVIECCNGEEAVRVFGELRPEYVTMDVMMEGMSGVEATRRITTAFPEAKVIAVSAYADVEIQDAARQAGACLFVAKLNLLPLLQYLSDAVKAQGN